MRDRVVSVVAIVAGAAVVLGVLGLVGWLITAGHSSEALVGLLGTAVVAYLQTIKRTVSEVKRHVEPDPPAAESAVRNRTP